MYSPCQTLMNNCFSYPLLQSIILNFQNCDSFGMLFHFQNDLNPFLLIILCVYICDSMCVHVYVCVCSFVMCEHMNIHVHECRTCMPRKVCRVTSEDGFSHGSLPDTLRQESLVLWGLPLQATLGACRTYPPLLSSHCGTLQFQILCASYGPQGLNLRFLQQGLRHWVTSQCCSLILMTFWNQIIFNLSAVLYQHM